MKKNGTAKQPTEWVEKTEVKGIQYSSIREASKAVNKSRNTLKRNTQKKLTTRNAKLELGKATN